jgi:GH24 family phage-related lysozyme (muramidase)
MEAIPATAVPPPVVQRTAPAQVPAISADFVAYIKNAENPNKVGYVPAKKRWFPHKDPSGGWNIGYGHHFTSAHEYVKYRTHGMTDEEVNRLLIVDIERARKVVYDYIQKRYGVRVQLTPKQEQILIDYVYTTGGLDKFTKMTDAVLRGDHDGMAREYKRTYSAGGKTHELRGRNAQFANKFLSK